MSSSTVIFPASVDYDENRPEPLLVVKKKEKRNKTLVPAYNDKTLLVICGCCSQSSSNLLATGMVAGFVIQIVVLSSTIAILTYWGRVIVVRANWTQVLFCSYLWCLITSLGTYCMLCHIHDYILVIDNGDANKTNISADNHTPYHKEEDDEWYFVGARMGVVCACTAITLATTTSTIGCAATITVTLVVYCFFSFRLFGSEQPVCKTDCVESNDVVHV